MADQPFRRIEVYHQTLGSTMVVWDMNPGFREAGPWLFEVFASRSGVGDDAEWTKVGEATNTFWLVDPTRWVYGVSPRLSYRVKLTTGKTTYMSFPKQIVGNLPWHDYLILRDIMRKEGMRLRKYAGACGKLIKRRHWGPPCPNCTDYDTGESVNANCQVCYGTSIDGGYFPAVDYWIAINQAAPRRATAHEEVGIQESQVKTGRGLACPWLDTNDVWVQSDNDMRFFIQSVKAKEYRGMPFVFDPIELRVAPTTDIVYNLSV